jgi:hypothetical protein
VRVCVKKKKKSIIDESFFLFIAKKSKEKLVAIKKSEQRIASFLPSFFIGITLS